MTIRKFGITLPAFKGWQGSFLLLTQLENSLRKIIHYE